jgi:hypothetical protein
VIGLGDVLAVFGQLVGDALLVPAGVVGQKAGSGRGAVQAQTAAEADARAADEDIGQGDSKGQQSRRNQGQVIRDLGSALHISRSYNVYA